MNASTCSVFSSPENQRRNSRCIHALRSSSRSSLPVEFTWLIASNRFEALRRAVTMLLLGSTDVSGPAVPNCGSFPASLWPGMGSYASRVRLKSRTLTRSAGSALPKRTSARVTLIWRIIPWARRPMTSLPRRNNKTFNTRKSNALSRAKERYFPVSSRRMASTLIASIHAIPATTLALFQDIAASRSSVGDEIRYYRNWYCLVRKTFCVLFPLRIDAIRRELPGTRRGPDVVRR